MTITIDWRLAIILNAEEKSEFSEISSEHLAPTTAKRTNAKFLIACGIQLITLLVMMTRALINKMLIALSAHTAHLNKCSNSAQRQ